MAPFRDSVAATKLPVNIVILGAASVGKTTVTLQFINEKRVESGSCPSTIEASFFKEVKLADSTEEVDPPVVGDESKERGVECLWKMEAYSSVRKHSSASLLNLQIKHKRKSSNNNELESNEFKTVVKVTDTASFKRAYAPRKSLKQRLAQRLTPRRRPPLSSPGNPVRRRYLHNFVESEKAMNAVPSFIYRKQDGKATIHDEAIQTADAFILVYSVQDARSFDTIQQIRSKILTARGHPCASPESPRSPPDHRRKSEDVLGATGTSRMAAHGISGDDCIPPIAVVGTHIDVTAPTMSPWSETPDMERKSSNESLLSSAFSFSPKRNGSRRRNLFHKQMSLASDVLSQTHKQRGSEVSAECVRGVVGAWQECVGFAEVSNDSVARLQRVFQHLTTRVIHRRITGRKNKSLPHSHSPRNSVISILRRQSTPEINTTGKKSCWPFKTFCFC